MHALPFLHRAPMLALSSLAASAAWLVVGASIGAAVFFALESTAG